MNLSTKIRYTDMEKKPIFIIFASPCFSSPTIDGKMKFILNFLFCLPNNYVDTLLAKFTNYEILIQSCISFNLS